MAYEVIAEGDVAVLTLLAEHDDGYQHQGVTAFKGDRFRGSADEEGDDPVLSPVVVQAYEKEADVPEEEQHVRKLFAKVGGDDKKPARAKKTEETGEAA